MSFFVIFKKGGKVIRRRGEPVVHDYTESGWGHNVSIVAIEKGGKIIDACGWGFGVEKGHHLLLANDGGSTRYRVKDISYYPDPRDMWHATLVFDPR